MTEEVRQSIVTHNTRLATQLHAVVKTAHFVQEKKHLPNVHETHYTGIPVPGTSVPTPNCFPQASLVSAFYCCYGAVVLFRAFKVCLSIKVLSTEWPPCCLSRV